MGPTALLPLRRKARWGFFRPKNPMASAGCEPANLDTRGQHATSRPPKPLIKQDGLLRCSKWNAAGTEQNGTKIKEEVYCRTVTKWKDIWYFKTTEAAHEHSVARNLKRIQINISLKKLCVKMVTYQTYNTISYASGPASLKSTGPQRLETNHKVFQSG